MKANLIASFTYQKVTLDVFRVWSIRNLENVKQLQFHVLDIHLLRSENKFTIYSFSSL